MVSPSIDALQGPVRDCDECVWLSRQFFEEESSLNIFLIRFRYYIDLIEVDFFSDFKNSRNRYILFFFLAYFRSNTL